MRGALLPEDFAPAEQDLKQSADKKAAKEAKAKECVPSTPPYAPFTPRPRA